MPEEIIKTYKQQVIQIHPTNFFISDRLQKLNLKCIEKSMRLIFSNAYCNIYIIFILLFIAFTKG